MQYRGIAFALVLIVAWWVTPSGQVTEINPTTIVLNKVCKLSAGTGTPEAVVTGNPCDIFLRSAGGSGTVGYIKETGSATNTGWSAMASAASLGSVTATLTNKTFDAEGASNVLTLPFVQYWAAGRCIEGVGQTSDWSASQTVPQNPVFFTGACWNGTNNQGNSIEFLDTSTGDITQQFLLPADWTGLIDVTIVWRTAVTTNSVFWQVSTACSAVNETIDPAWNTASTVADLAAGTTLRLNTASITAVTIIGCAADEMLWLRVRRDPANASDTLAATAQFIGMRMVYRRAI